MERLKLNIFSPLDYVVFASKSAVEEGRGDGGDCSKLNEANFIKTDPVHNTLGTVLQSHSYGALLRLSFVAKDSRKADNNMNPGLHAELATGKQWPLLCLPITECQNLKKKKSVHTYTGQVICGASTHVTTWAAVAMHELPTQQHASCIISRTSIRQSHSTVRLLMHEKSSWKSTLCSINTNSHITALSLRQQKIDQMENNSTFPQWTLKMWSHTILQRSLHCWQSIHNEISNCILEQLVCNVSLSSKAPAVWLLCWTDDPTVPFTTSVKQLFAFFFCALKDHK